MVADPPDAAVALADHALGLRWAAIPPGARRAAQTLLHDTLCVGAAGARAAHADAVLAMAQGWGMGDAVGVLGRPEVRLPAASAAFVNAFQIHGQEFDCVHEPAVLHPLATVVAALLAEAARGPAVSGETFLTALIAGVDVAVTLGLAAPGPLRFFRPATAGIFGSVAALARLRDRPRQVTLDGFGHALALASGTMQAHVEGKPALPLQVANAARGALVAIDLAAAGMPGVARPIEGPFGYFALFESESALPAALAGLGRPHRIEQVSVKPFPTGRAAHGGIGAVQRLMREHDVNAADIAVLEYHAPPLIHRLVGRAAFAGMPVAHARLCLPWLAAVTLTRGTVGLGDFERFDDPALLALAARVRVIDDGNSDPAAFVPARLDAQLRDGRTVTIAVDTLLGSPALPLTAEQHAAKARACLEHAGLSECHGRLSATIATFDTAPDVLAALRATEIIG